jgi:hypothetical protein
MQARKKALKEIEDTTLAIKHVLGHFQLHKLLKFPERGVIDIPAFNIRLKYKFVSSREDGVRVFEFSTLEEFDEEDLFFLLAEQGYIHWLRHATSSHLCFKVLNHKERWATLIQEAKNRAREQGRGNYRVRYLDSLLRRPLTDIFNTDPTTFDWIL